jgi:hypothetical protein
MQPSTPAGWVDCKGPAGFENALFEANLGGDRLSLTDGFREIVFKRVVENGIQIEIVYRFQADSYVMGFEARLTNGSGQPVKDSLFVALRNEFQAKSSSYVFEGPSALVERSLENVAIEDIAKKNTLTGNIKWYPESRYL